jgi:hypothetical protein
MGDSWASLAGNRVVSGVVTIPFLGTWTADLTLATDVAVASTPILTIGNLTMQGAVVRQDSFAGVRQVRLVGGFGGWMKQVTARAYTMPLGASLPVSLVLLDVAREVGETLKFTLNASFGSQFVREAASAQRTLEQVSGGQWWIDPSGTTHIGARPTQTIQSPFQVIAYDGGRGSLQISTEDPAAWIPGATFSSSTVPTTQQVSLVTHTITSDGAARIDVLAMPSVGSGVDRIIAALRALIKTELPSYTFNGVYEYAVQASADGVTVDASPASSGPDIPGVDTPKLPLPTITKLRLRSGLAGCSSTPKVGSILAVSFLNGDPSKPIVLGGYDASTAQQVLLGDSSADFVTPASYSTALRNALHTFLTGLNSTTLAGQALTFLGTLNALVSEKTTIVKAK